MIRSHALRAAISEEMHVRRLPRFAAPCRLMQIVTLLGEGAGAAARDHIDALAGSAEVIVPVAEKYAVIAIGAVTLVWERHTEFATYTLLRRGDFDALFDPALFEPQLAAVLADMPGEILRATQIALVAAGTPDPTPEDREGWFAAEATVICDVADGAARILSDFRLHPDGYGRLIVLDRDLAGDEPAQLVLRLQELGNYRNMALLGLPIAQRLTPTVSNLETRLAELTRAVAERTSEDDQLLDELTYLSAELARLVAETRYRMSATRAYAQLSSDRLASLRIGLVRGHQTLADFTERRLTPAVRTCDSFSARLEDLSQRAAWTSELLRTRIDIALAKQNRDLLTSMDRRTDLQLRLQQTVEGLSVAAISYYLVALIGYPLGAVPGLRHDWAMAAAVPIVLAGVTLALVRLRRRLHD
ncbi:putative membrane-anchored protein [Sphingomonas vulcanisoli]|uniref:Membrane-anchored protein n=1 Tax=Sphingomonas vulcanisoli TaxID=1658060 RepID=A0ABX0TVP9_9SPHN|nr:putative membrane-anchored protein [Sphingomonas vulcanisoli]